MYSADGKQVTLYLDGVGVPVTQSQRALAEGMAKMAHDFYEVVFLSNDPLVVARATWEIGQSAGIKGVYRENTTPWGHLYPPTTYSPSSSLGFACLFVGRKVDKTLLAWGQMTHVDGSDFQSSPWPYINSSTKSVTFTVMEITSKLDIDSNVFIGGTSFELFSGDAEKVSLGGVEYPYYKLPKSESEIRAMYVFKQPDYAYITGYFRLINDGSIRAEAIKREPRFLSGGRYYYVQQAKLDTGTTVVFDTINGMYNVFADGESARFVFDYIYFFFDTSNSNGGIFSFTFQIPVYNLTRITSGDGVDYTTWYIRPGFGRSLYDLDNGEDVGGCILMGTEDSIGDMMEIFTAGMPW